MHNFQRETCFVNGVESGGNGKKWLDKEDRQGK